MGNRAKTEQEVEVNNVVIGAFPMFQKPITAQITIHVNNMIITYGPKVIQEFKEYLYNPDDKMWGSQIKRLIDHYGIKVMKDYFTLIYGWQFEKAG